MVSVAVSRKQNVAVDAISDLENGVFPFLQLWLLSIDMFLIIRLEDGYYDSSQIVTRWTPKCSLYWLGTSV